MKKILKWFNTAFYAFIAVFCIILIILNVNVIKVTHSSMGYIPVIIQVDYTTINVSIFYVLLMLSFLNLIFNITNKYDIIRKLIILATPVISLIFILLSFFSPQSILISPLGNPPTSLDLMYVGGIIGVFLLAFMAIIPLISLVLQKKMIEYYFILFLILGAALLGDFIHECGHAFFVLLSGGRVTQFFPFPVLMGREFNAGYVSYENVPTNLEPLVLLGGEIFQWITILILSLTLYIVTNYNKKKQNNHKRIKNIGINEDKKRSIKPFKLFLISWLVISWLDFPLYTLNNSVGLPHWFIVGSTQGDIIMFCTKTGLNLWIMIILAIIQLGIGIFIIAWKKFLGKK
ncbi:MAG: hypothetical protein GF329_19440 [Candidatus Lokiarchaeota archaeon]|nr:hypothetical protein [Candidatus Lokiarchaeota archaeon]